MADLLRRLRQTERALPSDARPYVDRILAAFGPETEDGQVARSRVGMGPSSPPVLIEAEGLVEPLTDRELEVLALLAQHLTYKEIAAQLVITPGTVSGHAVRIYQKLRVDNRRRAVLKAQALGILHHK